jgi:DNA-binding response OmpR family regulator
MTEKILIVDENPGIRRALKRFLSQNGYSVISADSVQSASLLINQSTPSLVILDIKMPRFDGIEFIRQLREGDPALPVIAMTAYPTFFTREEALKNGVSAYVTKPFDPADILEYICQLQICGKVYGN